MSNELDVAAQLAAVQEGFIAKIPAKMTAITQSWQACKVAGYAADDLKIAYKEVHALAGTSGVLSIVDVNKLSDAIQLLLLKMMSNELSFETAAADVDDLIAQLNELVAQGRYEKSPIDLK